MLDSNTNKVTWIGVAIGVVAILGLGSSALFPEAFDGAKSQIVKLTTGFADGKLDKKSETADKSRSGVAVPEITDDFETSIFGYTFNDADKTATITGGKTSTQKLPKDLTVPARVKKDGVTYTVNAVGKSAFYYEGLTAVSIPSTIKTVGENAFGSNRITSLKIADGLTSVAKGSFSNNDLIELAVPKTLASIGQSAFANNNIKNVTIPGTVKTIGVRAFSSSNIERLVLEDGVTSIEDSAFYSNKLTYVSVPGSLKSIGESAFSSNQITDVDLHEGLETIGHAMFFSNNLKHVKIPNSVKLIDQSAFMNNQLESVDLGTGVQTIGEAAFANNNFNEVDIPGNVKTVGYYAFADSHIKKLTLHEGLETIDTRAFDGDGSDGRGNHGEGIGLNDFPEVTIPKSVKLIKSLAFGESLKQATFKTTRADSKTELESSAFDYKTKLIYEGDSESDSGSSSGSYNSVVVVNGLQFSLDSDLTGAELLGVDPNAADKNPTEIVIPSYVTIQGKKLKVTTIGGFAFFNADKLSKVTIPDTVKVIDTMAFNSTNIRNVYIPDTVELVKDQAFGLADMTPVESISYNSSKTRFEIGFDQSFGFGFDPNSGDTKITDRAK